MSLIAAQGEPTALDQLGNVAEDCNIPNQEHMAQRDSLQAHEAQGQDGVAPEKREMGLHSEASRPIGINPSQTQRRVISITDLPLEVLRGVFEFFQHPATVGQSINLELIGMEFGVDQLSDIQNLRLSCQLFNTLASPLLVPIIRVEVDQPSLDRVLALRGNPLVAAGVLAIQVELRYYFNVVAASLLEFVRYRSIDLYIMQDYLLHLKILDIANARRSGQAVSKEVHEMRELSWQRSRAFASACERHVGEQSTQHDTRLESPAEGPDPDLVEQYYEVIRVAYENYRVKYHDQHRIATAKSLVNELAKSPGVPQDF
ncbi:unnamed protein product [Clonostachys rhizophaga]|uniref:Uncharacterized protein n=1 Tax=Clonostachys rhizophaga TaxID=160324 RepID=A0A9N9YB12_9HYPO|nr:unnamed protein product [Clonostachys rhizophaga]